MKCVFVRDLKSQVQRGTKKVQKKIIFITDLFLVRCSMKFGGATVPENVRRKRREHKIMASLSFGNVRLSVERLSNRLSHSQISFKTSN